MLTPETAKLLVARANADAEHDDPSLTLRPTCVDQRDDLVAGQPVDGRLALLCLAHLSSRIVFAQALLHRPVVEADEDRVGVALGIRRLPARERALDVVPAHGTRVAVADVLAVLVEPVAIAVLGAVGVDPAIAAHVLDVQLDRLGELHVAPVSRVRTCGAWPTARGATTGRASLGRFRAHDRPPLLKMVEA